MLTTVVTFYTESYYEIWLDEDAVDVPAAVSEAPDAKNDGVDVFEAESSFPVGKSPPENGNAASTKISGTAGGLGEGSPKVCSIPYSMF